MELEKVESIPGALIGRPTVWEDDRGAFMEIMREQNFPGRFVQSNHSHSKEGVLRGLHYHRKQADLWYVMNGKAQAMMADLRAKSERPAVVSVDLEAGDPKVLYIPPGVAHGFLALTDVDLIYWVTNYYDSTDEFGIPWDDPTIQAPWRIDSPLLSDRDKQSPKLEWDSIELS